MLVRVGSDARTLARAHSGRVFSRCWKKHWWCTQPRQFVELHLPDEARDQLLERPISEQQWARLEETKWTPTTFTGMKDGDDVLAPLDGRIKRGQSVEFRIFLAERDASSLRLKWDEDNMPPFGTRDADALGAKRVRGGYEHSVRAQARGAKVAVYREGRAPHYEGLAEWKVE
eukprot:COSAG04_NODE_893_length_9595_cov_4.687763_5_plen_173_part_00